MTILVKIKTLHLFHVFFITSIGLIGQWSNPLINKFSFLLLEIGFIFCPKKFDDGFPLRVPFGFLLNYSWNNLDIVVWRVTA
jgi:hypothetical protein